MWYWRKLKNADVIEYSVKHYTNQSSENITLVKGVNYNNKGRPQYRATLMTAAIAFS